MGLDNFPHEYPCRKQGTAVMEQRIHYQTGEPLLEEDGSASLSIDCEKTQEAGGCPYKNDYEKSGLDGGKVYGIFGTDCWYRGKYGNHLAMEAGFYDETEGLSFYGALGDGTHKSPHECIILADAIAEWVSDPDDEIVQANEGMIQDMKYAEWYLRWASEKCGGLGCWY